MLDWSYLSGMTVTGKDGNIRKSSRLKGPAGPGTPGPGALGPRGGRRPVGTGPVTIRTLFCVTLTCWKVYLYRVTDGILCLYRVIYGILDFFVFDFDCFSQKGGPAYLQLQLKYVTYMLLKKALCRAFVSVMLNVLNMDLVYLSRSPSRQPKILADSNKYFQETPHKSSAPTSVQKCDPPPGLLCRCGFLCKYLLIPQRKFASTMLAQSSHIV